MTSTLPPGYISSGSLLPNSYTDDPDNENPDEYTQNYPQQPNTKGSAGPSTTSSSSTTSYTYIQEGDTLLSQNISSLSNETDHPYNIHNQYNNNIQHIQEEDHQQQQPHDDDHSTYYQQHPNQQQYDQYNNTYNNHNTNDYVYQTSSFPPVDPYYYNTNNLNNNNMYDYIDDSNMLTNPQTRKITWSDECGYALVQIHYSDKLHYSEPAALEDERTPLGCCIII